MNDARAVTNARRLYAVTLGHGTGSALTLTTEFVEADFQDRAAEEALARKRAGGLAWDVLAVHEALPCVRCGGTGEVA